MTSKHLVMETKNLCPSTTATIFACHSIVNSFAENIFELAHIRKEWSVEYAGSLKKEAGEVIEKLIASGNISGMMEKLRMWRELMISALTDIGIIRASVKNDFKTDREFQKEFFQVSGYNDYFSDAKNGDHFSMYEFTQTFARNLNSELREKILAGGLDPKIVDRLLETAAEMQNFSECFSLMKESTILSPGDRERIEKLYSEVRNISRIATAYYYFDPPKREAFNFFKALRNIKV
jgi:hypothetical protein